MPRTLFAVSLTLALLAGVASGNALAGPPEGVSGRMVVDEAPRLRGEVTRLERAAARPGLAEGEKDDAEAKLAEARACLATAEGLPDAAAAQWRKAIAFREKELQWALKKLCLTRRLRGDAGAARRGPLQLGRGRGASFGPGPGTGEAHLLPPGTAGVPRRAAEGGGVQA